MHHVPSTAPPPATPAPVNLIHETRLSLAAVARDQGVSTCTVWRWATRGVGGVTLETFMVGGRRYTTAEAFARFVARRTAGVAVTSVPTGHALHRRSSAIDAAERYLDEAGA